MIQAELSILLPPETLKLLSDALSQPFRLLSRSGETYFTSESFDPSSRELDSHPLSVEDQSIGVLQSPRNAEKSRPLFAFFDAWVKMTAERDLHQFDSEHRKLLIRQIQSIATRLSPLLDESAAIAEFIEEIRSIFPVKRISVFTIDSKGTLLRTSNFGLPIDDLETVRYACYSGKPLISDHPAQDSRLLSLEGASRSETASLKNLLVVPILAQKKPLGAVYLADRDEDSFSPLEVQVLSNLGQILSNALSRIENHRQALGHERVRATLSRYLSPNLAQKISEDASVTETWKGKRIDGTVLFSDLRSFTKLAEQFEPESIVAHLNDYFDEMTQEIFKEDGTLDKFVGDMIMAIFGAPTPFIDAPLRAVRAAIAMQNRLVRLNADWVKNGRPPFHMGIGINTGPMVFGNLGSKQAMGITVIGDSVNIAQRLQSIAQAGEILITPSVLAALPKGHQIETDDLGEIEVKGKRIAALRVLYDAKGSRTES